MKLKVFISFNSQSIIVWVREGVCVTPDDTQGLLLTVLGKLCDAMDQIGVGPLQDNCLNSCDDNIRLY